MSRLIVRISALALGISFIPAFFYQMSTGWPLDQIELSMLGTQALFGSLFIMYGLGKFPKATPRTESDATRIRRLEAKVAYLMEQAELRCVDADAHRHDRSTTPPEGLRPARPCSPVEIHT